MFFIHDYDPESLQLEARNSPAALSDGVIAIEELLETAPPPGMLYQIVTNEGNRMLGEETDAAAAAWLKELVLRLRHWLAENAPAEHQLALRTMQEDP